MKNSDKTPRFPLFAAIDGDKVEALTAPLPRKQFRKGDIIIKQGGKDLKGYLLIEGKVGIYAESDGIKTTLLTQPAPFLFGEIELLQEKPNLASVVAMEPCTVLILTRPVLLQWLHSNHQLSINFAQMVTRVLYNTAVSWRLRIFGQVEHLVANTLCSYAQMYGEEHRYGVLVQKEINKSELAEIVGVARKSIIRALDQLQKEGLIQLDKKQLIIPDLGALRAKANAPFPI